MRLPEATEAWTIEIVSLLNWEDFAEPYITVETCGEAAIDDCSCETYTLDDTGSVTSGSDCDMHWNYDFKDDGDSPATWFDF